LLTTNEVAARLRVVPGTLRFWRWHMNVGNWVIPSALAVADGHPRLRRIPTIGQSFG
jgi:hypothetical protein